MSRNDRSDPQQASRRQFVVQAGLGVSALVLSCAPKEEDASASAAWQEVPGSGAGDTGGGNSVDSGTADTGFDTGGGDTADTGLLDTADTGVDTGIHDTADTGKLPDCDTTPARAEGPFYLEDAPERANLNVLGEDGETIRVTGRVLDADCNPMEGAIVDVWHCCPEHLYDLEKSGDYRFRGVMITNAAGEFEFTTIYPPYNYQLDPKTMKPTKGFVAAHIHFKVSGEGMRGLTSQVQFADDKLLAEAYSGLIMDLVDDGSGVRTDHIDFVLAPQDTGMGA